VHWLQLKLDTEAPKLHPGPFRDITNQVSGILELTADPRRNDRHTLLEGRFERGQLRAERSNLRLACGTSYLAMSGIPLVSHIPRLRLTIDHGQTQGAGRSAPACERW
jgi:hypothetical protein